MVTLCLRLTACAVLNRARGDDKWMPGWLRGRALYYTAPLIGAIAGIFAAYPSERPHSFGRGAGAKASEQLRWPRLWGRMRYAPCGCRSERRPVLTCHRRKTRGRPFPGRFR
jgi:hypothetical protein